MESYMKFMTELSALKWTDAELSTLPKKYTDHQVFVALMGADLEEDKKNFYAIFLGGGERRTLLLHEYIKRTIEASGENKWNLLKVNKK